jgi:hypothetical protein
MSRYKSLATEEDNTYYSIFAASSIIKEADVLQPTPLEPVINLAPRMGPVPNYPVQNSTRYGPITTGYASLRYYGNGVY